jgi:membrane protease YdiL (CAAX protease family)
MRHYPNIPQAAGLLLLFVLLQFVFAVPVGLIGMATETNLTSSPLTIAVVNLLSIGLLLHFGFQRTQASFREVFPLSPIRPALLLPMALTIIGLSILLSEVDNRLRTVLPIPARFMEILEQLFGAPQNLLGAIFTLVIVAPLTEELLVRGLVLRGFLSHYSVRKAILASALFFAVLHFNPWQFTSAAVAGVVLAWWYVKTRSLLPCLFGHALNNALPLILLAIPQLQIPGYSTELTEQIEFQPLWFNGLGLLLAGWGIGWLLIEFEKFDAPPTPEAAGILTSDLVLPDNGKMENPQ